VASLVRDGDCIQIGVGGLAAAVAEELAARRRHLGLHTGLIDDGVLAMIDSGAVTNARKAVEPGVSVSPVVAGTKDLYRRLHGRDDIVLRPVDFTNDPAVIGQIDNMVTINSALEVDLLGQTNAEVAGGRRVSAIGGQLEFCGGAARSAGGRVIVTIRATAKGGEISRIVPAIGDGCVSLPSSLVHFVVTEFGVADLRGATVEERVRRVAAIAHPDFRASLLAAGESDLRLVAPTPAAT
jgi:4-hydroxybutyrate CoA-transferase